MNRDRLDEAKRLRAETTSGEWNARTDLATDCEGDQRAPEPILGVKALEADGLRSCDRDSIIALHSLAPDLFALAEAAETMLAKADVTVLGVEPKAMVKVYVHSVYWDALRAAVDRVRGRA